ERVLKTEFQAAQALEDRAAKARTLHQWGTRSLCLGDVGVARAALSKALRLREASGDQAGAAVTRHNLNLLRRPWAVPLKGLIAVLSVVLVLVVLILVSMFNQKPGLQSLQLNPHSVLGGNGTRGMVILTKPAPPGGLKVALRSDQPSAQVTPAEV